MRKLIVSIPFLFLLGRAEAVTYVAPTTLVFSPAVAITGTTTGTWVDLRYYNTCDCNVRIAASTSGATLYIDMSNTPTGSAVPNRFTNAGVAVGSIILADVNISYSGVARWFRARIEANATSTVWVDCIARSF